MKKFLFLVFVLCTFFHLFIAYLLPQSIPENNYPYRDILLREFRLDPFTRFANFDGYQYISIAKNGYSGLQESFFPLFPGVISLANHIFRHYIISGVFVSSLFFLLGLVYFYKLAFVILKDKSLAKWAVVLLASFPTAFFFQMIYTESLFLFLSAGALYYLYTKKLVWAALFAVCASLTKTQGVLLLIPFVLVIIVPHLSQWRKLSFKSIVLSLAPLYGLLMYSGYLYYKYQDPLYFYHAQSAFNLERSVGSFVLFPQVMYRYTKIFLTTPPNVNYYIAMLEFVVFVGLLVILGIELVRLFRQKKKDLTQISLQGYSLIALLLPTLTGTFVSIPRFALISLGFFLILARIPRTWPKALVVIFFLLLQGVVYLFFLKGYFVS